MKKNRRILVIDDDSGIRNAFTGIFSDAKDNCLLAKGRALFEETEDSGDGAVSDPYELAFAESGEEGVARVQDAGASGKPYAVVFLDMKMPGMDGAEAARRISLEDSGAKIVIMTAYSEFKAERIGAAAGRNDLFYIRKPFSGEEIRQFARSLTYQWNLEKDRVRLREELERANATLEDKVTARTRQLARANQRLAALDQDKMSFLRYLSHEMNTPLNWVGAVEIIDKETLSSVNREILDFTEKGFERLSKLVRAVIDYFEMAGRDIPLNHESIPVADVIFELIALMKEKIKESGIKMGNFVDPDLRVAADPLCFREILTVLLKNAVDYSRPGGIVTITGSGPEQPFRLTVEDQGKGIPGENLKSIFEAFATESCHRREAGFGLSLPRARLVAEAHGWDIRAESGGDGRGARITVEAAGENETPPAGI